MFPEVRGTREMVGGGNNFVVEAGFRILQAGGNAVDAGVAATLGGRRHGRRSLQHGRRDASSRQNDRPARQVVAGVGAAPMKATVDFFRNRKLELGKQRIASP